MKQHQMNKKVVLGIFAILCGILVIAVCSFTPFIIDPSRWQTTEFLSDELIISAIVIFAILAVMAVAQASNQADPKSFLCKARASFFETIDKVSDRSAFGQWVREVLQPRDFKSIRERELMGCGIDDFTILDLDRQQIKELLSKPQKYGDRYYKTITKSQYKTIIGILDGKCYIKPVPPEYYLNYKGMDKCKTITERAGKETSVKTGTTIFNVAMKLIITIIPAMVFASLVRDAASEMTKAEAWLKFASRMFAFATSSFQGWLLGCKLNDIDASYIEMRVMVHKEFLNDKSFKPKSQQELARQDFIERVRKDNIEYGALLLESKSSD